MIVELNIGLNVEGADNSDGAVSDRAVSAVRYIRQFYQLLGTRRHESQYVGPAGPAIESCLVVKLDVALFGDLRVAMEDLAGMLGQDCIAIYLPSEQKGYLEGPNAAKWGGFNPEFFNRFEV